MIHLQLYDFGEDFDGLPTSRIGIKDYLEKPPKWVAVLQETLLIFDFLSDELNESLNPFGVFDFIYPQFEEAICRLEKDRFALLRSCGDFGPLFLIFEPKDSEIQVSLLGCLEQPFSSYYPYEKSPFFTSQGLDQRAELYGFVEQNPGHIDSTWRDSTLFNTLQNMKISKQDFIKSLKREVTLSRKFIANRESLATLA